MVVDGETLTPNQAARRERVLDAAMNLAAEGGYDAVQMRDVATRAQVALGTIYRYFTSKDHLLAACQLELWRAMAGRFERRPPAGGTPADRVVELLHPAMRAAELGPRPALTGSGRARRPGRDHGHHGRRPRRRDGRPRPAAEGPDGADPADGL